MRTTLNTIPMTPVIPVIPGDGAKDRTLEVAASPARLVACPQRGDRPPEETVEPGLSACPLQTAMRHVTEAALTQHVLYAEGDWRPREELLHELHAWLRLHELIASGICPATRAGGGGATSGGTSGSSSGGSSDPLAPAELELALAGVPEPLRAQMAAPLRVCGRRSRGDGCPLDAPPPAASLLE